jgi:hypothetical protein
LAVKIAKEFKIEFEEHTIPSDTDVEAVEAELITALLEGRIRMSDKLQTESSQLIAPLGRERGSHRIVEGAITATGDKSRNYLSANTRSIQS